MLSVDPHPSAHIPSHHVCVICVCGCAWRWCVHAAWDSGRPRLCVHTRCDTTSMRCQRGCVGVALLCSVILLPCASVACFVLSRTVLCSVVFVTGPAATLWSSNSSAPFAAVRHFLEEDDGRSDGRSDAAVVLHTLCLNQLAIYAAFNQCIALSRCWTHLACIAGTFAAQCRDPADRRGRARTHLSTYAAALLPWRSWLPWWR